MKKQVICSHCKYSWKSKCNMDFITCPCCQLKTRIKEKGNIIEIDLDKIIGLDEEERDSSVNFYEPFYIVGEENGKQVQIYLDWDTLITLALKIKPYLESYEAQNKIDEEMEKDSK